MTELKAQQPVEPTQKRKMIEVAIPLEALNAACKADKDRKTGHIRNIHKWFAPMPLPALRAIIYSALVDAPTDPIERQSVLAELTALVESGPLPPPPRVIAAAVKRIRDSVPQLENLLIVDPFCGGGSTILEAQRFGLRAAGSDLNPIPVLITTTLTSIPSLVANKKPLHSDNEMLFEAKPGLAGFLGDVWHYARKVRGDAWSQLQSHYPLGPNGDPVIVWWWANTVPSPDPSMRGAHTPLVNNWTLSLQKGKHLQVVPIVDKLSGTIRFDVAPGQSSREASKNRCVFTDTPISFEYIREQGSSRGLRTAMLALVTSGASGRNYFAPDDLQVAAASSAVPSSPPELPIEKGGLGIRVTNYGVSTWDQVFTSRQQLALETFAALIAKLPEQVVQDGGSRQYGDAIATVLGLSLGKLAQACSKNVQWRLRKGPVPKAEVVFSRADLQFMWDFAETNPFAGSVGDWLQTVKTSLRAFEFVEPNAPQAIVRQEDARRAVNGLSGRIVLVTDPPYYQAIGYSSLSEYFYVWIRKALRAVYPDLLGTIGVPKETELIAAPARHGGAEQASRYFTEGFKETFRGLLDRVDDEFPLVVVYAQRQGEKAGEAVATGWEAMLEAMISSGLAIVGTWPIWGTGSTRMRARDSNALASYILLVCRKRPTDSPLASRKEYLDSLRRELPMRIKVMQEASVAPVDLAQAAIGPGMAVYTRYANVLDADGKALTVREALALINQTLDDALTQQDGDFDSDSRWALTWFEQSGFDEGEYGIAEQLSKSKNTSVDGMVDAGIVESRRGKVRLLRAEELPGNWDPATDPRLTAWEVVHHLIRVLASGGEGAAAELVSKLGAKADVARELAYRLFTLCERKKRATEALAYNGLVQSWPEITRLAREGGKKIPAQADLFEEGEE